ncbi:hypothetical protein CEXT_669611 [Caerostris extrusa]|uniref:Uncharacterized protein n=1 Tax=Caerostris extrusa TaxID=172846 RepID=A0AAV4Y005_CAEEX|nr:hypothetical protein CEXT_669611 [Caerostris extrusa]
MAEKKRKRDKKKPTTTRVLNFLNLSQRKAAAEKSRFPEGLTVILSPEAIPQCLESERNSETFSSFNTFTRSLT